MREIGIVLSMLVFIVKSNEFLNFLVVIMISVQILFEVFNADSHQKKKQAKSKRPNDVMFVEHKCALKCRYLKRGILVPSP